jgi:hypothetical protein
LFEVWDRREEVVIQYTASEIVGRALSLDPGSLLAPPYHDVTTVQSDLAAAGFTNLSFETLPERSRTGSAREAAIATCQGGCCVAISNLTLRIVSKRSPKPWPQLWLINSVRDRSTRQCRPSCSRRLARPHFSASGLEFTELDKAVAPLPPPMPSKATERHKSSRLWR